MKITGDQHYVKEMNKAIVLQTIMQHQPLSRAQISEQTGLNKATVSTQVEELLQEKMIDEIGPGHAVRGRKPVLLLFNKSCGYSVGIDIGVHYVLSVLTDLEGNIIREQFTPHDNADPDSTMELIHRDIDQLKASTLDSPYGIVGIGVAVPGIVDHEGTVLFAPNLDWRNVALKQKIEQRWAVPATVCNEANAGAIGEKTFGSGQNYSSLIYVSAGIGIGVGIVLNDHLFTGTSGYAGEFGHATIEHNGKKCSCGSRGCWELYASEKALLVSSMQRCPELNDTSTIDEILQLTERNRPELVTVFQQIGYYLGLGAANLINTFNPEAIIFGNNLAKAKQWLDSSLRQAVAEHALKFHRENIVIDYAAMGLYANARGVATLTKSAFFQSHYLTAYETSWG